MLGYIADNLLTGLSSSVQWSDIEDLKAQGVPLIDVLRRLTLAPATLLRISSGRLAKGAPADLVLFDPGAPRKIDPVEFRSRSKNSPFKGRLMQGRVSRTMVAGTTVFQAP